MIAVILARLVLGSFAHASQTPVAQMDATAAAVHCHDHIAASHDSDMHGSGTHSTHNGDCCKSDACHCVVSVATTAVPVTRAWHDGYTDHVRPVTSIDRADVGPLLNGLLRPPALLSA
jgi:hypothetical protein